MIKNLEPVTHPEVELLLCCARTNIAAETAERIKSLVQQEIEALFSSERSPQPEPNWGNDQTHRSAEAA
jgi:hypothetical protein